MSFEVVKQVRSKYPTPLGAAHGQFLMEVASATGKGLVRKDWGTFVRLPDGTGVSQDCVMDITGRHWDILVDGENSAGPAWELVVDSNSGQPLVLEQKRYYDVPAVAPEPPLVPLPDPEPVPPAADPASEARLRALEESFDRLAGAVKELALLAEQRFQLVGQELDDLDGRLKRPQTVGVRTERRLYHDHDLKLEIPGK